MQPKYNDTLRRAILMKYRSQQAFAAAVGIDPAVISKYLHGWKIPTPEAKAKIAATLGAPIDTLFPV